MSDKVLYTPQELKQLIAAGNVTVIDVRDSETYAKEHISGAANINAVFSQLSMTTKEGLREMIGIFSKLLSEAGVSKDKKVIFYEDTLNTLYGGSCRGYFQLTFLGHKDVGVLDGGLLKWKSEGFATSSEALTPTPTTFIPEPDHSNMVTKDIMKAALNDPSIKILDNRDEEEWVGVSSSPYGVDFAPRKGRIPGAKWVEWYRFMESDDTGKISHFITPDATRELLATNADMHPDDDIIVYCFKGARASNTLLAMKLAGFKNVRNYYGSWNEWSRDDSCPIDDSVLEWSNNK